VTCICKNYFSEEEGYQVNMAGSIALIVGGILAANGKRMEKIKSHCFKVINPLA
jgi:hypothetical protein